MIPQAVVPFESKLALLFIGGVVGAYLVCGGELTTFKDNRLLLGFLLFIVMMLALYGLVIHFRCPMKILWSDRYADYGGRLASTYICPNHFGHLMELLIPFCVALLFIPQTGIFLRLLAGYSFLVFLPTLFLTESRASWLGTLAGVGVVVCLMALRRSKKLFLLLVIFVPLMAVLLLFAGWKYSKTFQHRAKPVVEFLKHQSEEGLGSDVKDFRPQTWLDTIDMIKEAPWFGFGPGNYRYTFPEHRKRFRGQRIVTGHPHNEYLELIADYGLIGFALFALAWLYGVIRILIASLKAEEARHAFIGFAFLGTVAGTMVHSFFDFEMHIWPNALVFVLLAAMAWGPLAAAKRKTQRSLKPLNVETVKDAEDIGRGGGGALQLGEKRNALNDKILPTNNEKISTSLPSSSLQHSTFNVRLAAWLLAIGYLLFAFLCLQTMSSAYVRALADKKAEVLKNRHYAPDAMRHAQKLYEISSRIDSGNWRAYKGMGDLLFNEFYYSLDMKEKVQMATQESQWYAKAYAHNPKDPATVAAWGKCLIFLDKARSMEYGVGSMALGQPPVHREGKTEIDSTGRAGPPGTPQRANPRSVNTDQRSTINSLQTHGLELLRAACRYRPFNDVYWWTLGVELRKLGRCDEALKVFKHARSIRNTPSTAANIKWIETKLKKRAILQQSSAISQKTAGGGQKTQSNRQLQTPFEVSLPVGRSEVSNSQPQTSPPINLSITNATTDPGLLKLFNEMGN